MSKQKSSPRFRFDFAAIFLSALLFLLPAVRDGDRRLYLLAAVVPGLMLLCMLILARLFSLDRMIFSVALLLCSLGIAAFAPADPEAALAQSLRCGAGLAALLTGAVLVRSMPAGYLTGACTAFLGLLLLAGKLFSPALAALPLTEAALALLLISVASLFSRQAAFTLLPGIAALVLLLLAGDLTEAVLWGLTFLLLVFVADGRPLISAVSLAVVLLAFFGLSGNFPSLFGTQPVSSVSSLVSVGWTGLDVLPEDFPSGSASLFPLLAGHFGLLFSGLAVLLFLPFSLRGTTVAGTARTRFHAVLAMGATLLLALRTVSSMLSLFGISPLPGVSVPLLTSSLPELCAQFFLVGLLCGVSARNEADLAEDAHLAMLAH